MITFTYILVWLSYLLLGAHFLRTGESGLMIISLILPILLFIKRRVVIFIVFTGLVLGAIEWVYTTQSLLAIRQAMNIEAGRMLIIMYSVGFVTLISAFLLFNNKFLNKFKNFKDDLPVFAAFILTLILISIPYLKIDFPVLLAERFFTSFGWLQIFLLGLYAAYVAHKMYDPKLSKKWRIRIWVIFSIVFFTQLILGLIGFESFLMTGNLHLPVPAIILAGPIYRWELSFMVFLFLGSMVLAGPAWCSYLCYFGVWDNISAKSKKRPDIIKKYVWHIRISIFLLVVISALLLNYLGVSSINAAIFGGIFGLIGVIVIIFVSRKMGVMSHCTMYCPIGLLAVLLGKLSPFRIRITDDCTSCMKCHYECRYNALNFEDIKKGKPNLNCTLCGDCISPCEHSSINYRFFKIKPETARVIFIVIIVSLHTAFLAIGRI